MRSNKYVTAEGRKQTPLDTIRRTQDKLLQADYEKLRISAFETEVAFLVFTTFRLPAQVKWQLANDCAARSGEKGLKLPVVFDRYPALPFRLFVCPFRKLPQTLTISQIFSTFSTQPFTKAWNRIYAGLDKEDRKCRTIGLVHYWPYVAQHAMILHNSPPALDKPGVRVYCMGKEDEKKRVLTWEPLVNYFHGVDWKLEAEETQDE